MSVAYDIDEDAETTTIRRCESSFSTNPSIEGSSQAKETIVSCGSSNTKQYIDLSHKSAIKQEMSVASNSLSHNETSFSTNQSIDESQGKVSIVSGGSSNTNQSIELSQKSVIEQKMSNASKSFEDIETTLTSKETRSFSTNPSVDDTQANRNQSIDLFQKRQGKLLTWQNVNVTVKKSSGETKHILKNVWGSARNEVTAILGPSGGGKTSLLNVLSGRSKYLKNMKYESDIQFDGQTVRPDIDLNIRKQIAFVEQHDQLHVSATTRESIFFSARLRIPSTVTNDEIDKLTDSVINALGLQSCADTIIGGESIKGISGGERKRCSIGVEIVTNPSLIFLDEPTSGLDSFSALSLVKILHKLANNGASILLTLHQPSSDVLEKLDRLILMRAGRIMYQGSTEAVTEYFSERSHPLPPKYNPCDWILMVAQTVPEAELDQLGYFPDSAEEIVKYENFKKYNENVDEEKATSINGPVAEDIIISADANIMQQESRVPLFRQVAYLLQRDFRGILRNKMILGARITLTSFVSILVGLVFWKIGGSDWSDPMNVQSHFGAILVTSISAMLGSAIQTLIVFPDERPVFIREYSTNHYTLLAYFLARTLWEAFLTGIQIALLTFLTYFMVDYQQRFLWLYLTMYSLAMASTAISVIIGSSLKDQKMAIEFFPVCFLPQILFAGFFIAPDLIHIWLRWLTHVFPLTYGVKIVLANEFNRDCGSAVANQVCDYVLTRASVNVDDVWWYWLVLLCMFITLRIVALFVLQQKAMH